MKVFSLSINNELVPLIEDDDGLINLNDLHRYSGYGKAKQPSNWTRKLSKSRSSLLRIWKGGNTRGGTWAPRREALKYAGWLDEDFEDAVYEAFENLMEGSP